MGNLLTATLLDSYQWYLDCPPSWKQKATLELMSKIRRTDTFEPSEEIKRGMAFEDKICHSLDKEKPEFLAEWPEEERPLISTFYDKCKGGEQQRKTARDIEVDGMTFYLFGYIDIAFPKVKNLDIKTTSSYKGPDKYLKRHQHLIYMYNEETYVFEYLVAQFNEFKDGNGKLISSRLARVHNVPIISNAEEVEKRLRGKIRNFKHFLEQEHLMEDYLQLFCRGKGTPTGK